MLRVAVNIAYLRPRQVGGSEIYVRELCRALGERGDVALTLFCRRDAVESLSGVGATELCPLDAGPHSPLRRLWIENIGLGSAARSGRFDVLFSPANFAPPLLPARLPQVATIHDLLHVEFPHYFPRSHRVARDILLGATLRRCRRVIAISEYTRRGVLRRYRVSPERVVTVHEGGPRLTSGATRGPAAAHRRDDLGPYFIYPAMTAPHKNHLMLVGAFERFLADRSSRFRLVFTGMATAHLETIEREIERLGLVGRVVHLGFVPRAELLELIGGAEALLFPSLFEGFGLPPVEAMKLGVPVVSSDRASLPEVVGRAAMIVAPTDVEGWTAAMTRVTTDKALRDALVERGRERAERFSWAGCAARTLDVLRTAATR